MAATIKDLAKETKLGFATISRYLNGTKIKEENRVKIENAIKKLDYTINEYARGLRTSFSRSIGLIFTRVDDVFSSVLVANTQKCLTERGYSTILAVNNSRLEDEEKAIDFLIGRNVDGVISIPIYSHGGAYGKLKKRGIPTVFYDSDLVEYDFDSVVVDNEGIGRSAAEELFRSGHRDVGILVGVEGSYTADRRLKGFVEVFQSQGIELRRECVLRGMTDDFAGSEGMQRLLSLEKRPTAVFCSNYDLTLGGIVAINERRLEIGREISVVGVDNMSLMRVIKPKLTLVNQPYREIAERGVSFLLERIERGFSGGGRETVLNAQLCPGESVAKIDPLS